MNTLSLSFISASTPNETPVVNKTIGSTEEDHSNNRNQEDPIGIRSDFI